MKKFLFLIIMLFSFSIYSQSVTYQQNPNVIANPERGMYQHEGTDSSPYDPLSVSSLTSKRVNDKITLVLRLFYMEDFLTSNISAAYLNNIQTDFNTARSAGVKLIVRFAYSDGNNPGFNNPTKLQILSHINQLSPILQQNKDVIAVIQAGFIGAYGEWYYTDYFGIGNPTASQYIDRNQILQAILAGFPGQIQVRTPLFKQKYIGNANALTFTEAFSTIDKARIGHHNDSFLASAGSEQGTYSGNSANILLERAYVKEDTKYVAMGGEINTFNSSNSTLTTCANSTLMLDEYNYSYFNSVGYASGLITSWTNNGCLNEIKLKLGYRFQLNNSNITNNTLSIYIANNGYANLYNNRKAYLILKNSSTNVEHSFLVDNNVKNWTSTNYGIILDLNSLSVPNGTYKLYLNLPDPNPSLSTNPAYSIQLANLNTWIASNGYNDLLQTWTKSSLSVNTFISDNMISINGVDNYTFKLYDLQGRLIQVNNSDVSGLQTGVYMIKVKTSTGKIYTQKIYKK